MTKEQKATYQKEWFKKHPNYHKEWNRKNFDKKNAKRYKWLYGITLEQYNAMFDIQKGCCAICNKHQTEFKRRLSVDHCHETGKVRQLLCDLCNRALGYFKDSPELLETAASYLRKHNGAE